MKKLATLVAAVLLFPHGGHAQTGRPASPAGASAAEVTGRYNERGTYVGGKWIEIRYGRPIKRGRDLFGPSDFGEALNDGAPVWRAGANVSTRLITELPLSIGGKRIAPGEYTIFIDLKRNDWTMIVSSWPAQTTYDDKNKQALWGAYDYTSDKDIVRLPMKVENLPHAFEQLSWEFLDITDSGGRLGMIWDKKLASVAFAVAK
jgi:Protein of unknown function (DUF2911)